MRKPVALIVLLVGILVVIPIIIAMVILGVNHNFSIAGGATYYLTIVVLGVADAFTIPSVWGVLADDDPPRV